MKVKECMCTQVISANQNATISEVAKLMGDNHVGCIPVCDENSKVVGLVTDRDLILRCIACEKDCKQTPVSEIMTKKLEVVSPEEDLCNATQKMCDWQIRRIPVVDNYKLVGIITLGDLANNNVSPNEISNTVEQICKCGSDPKNAE